MMLSESMLVRTIVLKLYKPSRRKKEIIDEAMLNYSKAFQYLLDAALVDIDKIRNDYKDNTGKYRGNYVAKWVDKELNRKLNEFCIEPFKDSIKIDFASTLAGYLNQKLVDSSVEYPFAYISSNEAEESYKRIMAKYIETDEDLNLLEGKVNEMIAKSDKLRSLFFCRYSKNRNYSLLYDPEKDRYFAKIYLMNVKDEKRKRLTPREGSMLYYINKGKDVFDENLSRKCYELFPLSFGKWQERYLRDVIDNPGMIKTARLTKRNNEYYLSVNIMMERPEMIETKNYMGITRGIDNMLNYAVVDPAGNVVDSGFKERPNRELHVNDMHGIANYLINIAKEYRCQIIMERLSDKGDRLFWRDGDGRSYFPGISKYWYNRLFEILNYKLLENGIPKVIRVSGISIFYKCPNCGHNSHGNRFSKEMLICTNCGNTMDVEKAGTINLSKKLIEFKKEKIRIDVENTELGIRFVNEDLEFEYYPENPYDCSEEFKEKINSAIKNFYNNFNVEYKKKNFKKKLSLIKRLEDNSNIFELLEIN